MRDDKSLLFTNGKLIRIRQEVLDATLCTVVFQMVHHVRSVAFNLFATSHRTKYYFSETLRGKCTETDPSYRCPIFDNGQCFVFSG